MKTMARVIYGVFGALALGLSVLVLCNPALALSLDAYSPLTAHLIREQGAEGVFIGLMSLWCLFHFENRRAVHFGLLVFALLFAAVHWAEYFQARRHLMSPLINSVPFLALAVVTPSIRPVVSQR